MHFEDDRQKGNLILLWRKEQQGWNIAGYFR